MEFSEKVQLYNKYNILHNYFYNYGKLSHEFIIIYNVLLLIPNLNENELIINKIFYFYLVNLLNKFKILFNIPYVYENKYFIDIINNNKINIIDKLLLSNQHFIINIFQNINKFNKYNLVDIVSKITYLDNAKNILNYERLNIILYNKIFNEIFINNIFIILDYDELKKIVHEIPNEFIFLFAKNIIKNKINQNIFLTLDSYTKNTILHNLLLINGYTSTLYIWKNLLSNIKQKILNHKNRQGMTINNMIKPNKNGKYLYLK